MTGGPPDAAGSLGPVDRALRDAEGVVMRAVPHEGCGMLFRGAGGWRARAVNNALIAVDPVAARHRFEMAPFDLIAALKDADARRERLAAVFHSHIDAAPTVSRDDALGWAPLGAPLYPGAMLMIAEIRRGTFRGWHGYRWMNGRFVSAPIEMDGGPPQDIRGRAG